MRARPSSKAVSLLAVTTNRVSALASRGRGLVAVLKDGLVTCPDFELRHADRPPSPAAAIAVGQQSALVHLMYDKPAAAREAKISLSPCLEPDCKSSSDQLSTLLPAPCRTNLDLSVMTDSPAPREPRDPREQPILDRLLEIRTQLSLLKQDKSTYIKSQDVTNLYNDVIDQVHALNEIRVKKIDEQNRGESSSTGYHTQCLTALGPSWNVIPDMC